MTGFFLADRKSNPLFAGISSVVSARSSWLLLGVTTQTYVLGLSAIWLAAGFIASEFLMIVFLAPQIRKYSEKHNCLTLTDIFVSRFKDKKNFLRISSSFVIILFLMALITSQFIGGSRAFYAFFGLNTINGTIITGIVVLLVVFFGGLKTLNYTDLFNSAIILLVLIGMPLMVLIRKDGFSNLHEEIMEANAEFFSLKALSTGALVGFLSVGLGSSGNPHILVKYMSAGEKKSFLPMTVSATITNILMAAGAIIIGVFAKAYFPVTDLIPGADPQNVFIGLSGELLPPLLLGVVLAAIIASVISSAGSQILVSASEVVNDLYDKMLRKGKNISQAKLLFYSRIVMVILVYSAIVAGIFIETDYYGFVLFAWAGLGASIGPAILLSFTWKDSTNLGISAGILTGALTVIAWKSIPVLSLALYELFPGFIMAGLAIWIVSSLDKKLITRRYNKKARYEDIKAKGYMD